ncbi:hypothetical protein DET0317 [Dehalococcoides mccartyi 195]|uniref:Uncharacterized protein n=1 Tax=Dehalococcoides mccartyi (strain ATCC BAA-2266 / KCTC 15142 / 195) TaxID=243164 RepID=Q3Z9N4_DEHM1|nr:hypothetical protein DET0317 [Dehalococcoides mccartyi 195]
MLSVTSFQSLNHIIGEDIFDMGKDISFALNDSLMISEDR